MEIWKNIPGFDKYQVSNFGRVKSLKGFHGKKVRIMKPRSEKNGYKTVQFYQNSKVYTLKIHRLVMLSFVGESELQVNHKNGIKDDNRLVNLEYVTQKENSEHAVNTGLKDRKGSKHTNSKLNEKQVLEIRELLENTKLTQNEIGKKYNVSRVLISKIKLRKAWTHI